MEAFHTDTPPKIDGDQRWRRLYINLLAAGSALIVVPAAVVRVAGGSLNTLATCAVIQLFALLALLLTSPASLICGLVAAWTRQWKNAGAFCNGAVIPVITCGLAVATNLPGWEAVMAI